VATVRAVIVFTTFAGLGVAYLLAVGLICAVCAGGTGRSACDPINVRNHWRSHAGVAAMMIAVGLIGAALLSAA